MTDVVGVTRGVHGSLVDGAGDHGGRFARQAHLRRSLHRADG